MHGAQINLMFVGHVQAGKTSLAKGFLGFKGRNFCASTAPITFVFSDADKNGNTFQVGDTCVNNRKVAISFIQDNYKKQHGIVFVYDLSAKSTQAQQEFNSFCDGVRNQNLRVPIFVVGTKADLVTEPTKENNVKQNQQFLEKLSPESTELKDLNLGGVYFASERDPNNVDYNKRVYLSAQEESAMNSFKGVVSDIKKSVAPRLEKSNTAASQSQQSTDLASYDNKFITVGLLKHLLDGYRTTSMFACMGYMHSIIKKLDALTVRKEDTERISGQKITDCLSSTSWCCFTSKSSKYDLVERHLQKRNQNVNVNVEHFKDSTTQTLVSVYKSLN